MRGRTNRLAVFPLLGLAMLGCSHPSGARYVYQDGEYGVIGVPQNSSRWPTFYREQAEALMARHFPEGYEIVRAEEVVEGKRTTSKAKTTEAEIDPGILGPTSSYLKIGKLDTAATRKLEDQVEITEARIIYKRKGGPPPSASYSAVATLSPLFYIDPNAPARIEDAECRKRVAQALEKRAGQFDVKPAVAGEPKSDQSAVKQVGATADSGKTP